MLRSESVIKRENTHDVHIFAPEDSLFYILFSKTWKAAQEMLHVAWCRETHKNTKLRCDTFPKGAPLTMAAGSLRLKVDFTVVKLRHRPRSWEYLEAMHLSLCLKKHPVFKSCTASIPLFVKNSCCVCETWWITGGLSHLWVTLSNILYLSDE